MYMYYQVYPYFGKYRGPVQQYTFLFFLAIALTYFSKSFHASLLKPAPTCKIKKIL